MTQHELNHAVARATGDNLRVITRLGFSLADPVFVEHDPEPYGAHIGQCDLFEPGETIIDWDEHELQRNTPVVPQRSRRPVLV